MSEISKSDLEQLLEDDQLAEGAFFLQTISSWVNLRILDKLFSEESATAGEIARWVNMDMIEVKNGLEELESIGLVQSERATNEDAANWSTTSHRVLIEIMNDNGLRVDYSIGDSTSGGREGEPDPLYSQVMRAIKSFL